MKEFVLKGKIDQKKLDSIVNFLRLFDIEVEVKTVFAEKEKSLSRTTTFTDFGLTLPLDYKFDREEANAR